ncbi:uncharacterized protein [Diadema antillarum]|uniref:uncharacterized protein n=1 Tax=Diadema antillarum TaxID=105358 RepID=UPI003A8463F1
MGKKGVKAMQRRKPNYSLEEMKFLIGKYKEHRRELDSSKHLTQTNREEIWRDIYDGYREALPERSKTRTFLDVKRKMIKLRSEAQVMFKRERMRARGQDISRLSMRAKRMVMSRAHKMMLKVVKGYAIQPFDEEEDDIKKEEYNPPYIEYDDDGFVPCDDADDNSYQEADDEEDEDIDGENDDDDNDDDDDDEDEEHAERIMRRLLFPNDVLDSDNHIFGRKASTAVDTRERSTTPKRRKGNEERSATIQSILDLQREKMMIERDNLLLVQRKLALEVKLLEKRLLDAGGRLDSSGSGLGGCINTGGINSHGIPHMDGLPSDNILYSHTPDIKVSIKDLHATN